MASHPKRAHMDNVPDTPDQTESSSENESASDDESNDLEREIQVRTESIMTLNYSGSVGISSWEPINF